MACERDPFKALAGQHLVRSRGTSAPDGGGVMYGWQRDMTPEQREHDQLATYETALIDIVQRLAAGTITSAQVRNLMRGVMLRVDRDWDPTDYAGLMQQASQN